MAQISLVIFDLDGVLVDTTKIHQDALKLAISKQLNISEAQVEKTMDIPLFKAILGKTTKDKIKFFQGFYHFSEEDGKSIDTMKQIQTLHKLKNITCSPKVYELLDYFRDKKISLGLGSNTRRENLNVILQSTDLSKYFGCTIAGDEILYPKPNSHMYRSIMMHFGIPADNTLILEDSEVGITAAKNSGAKVFKVSKLDDVTKENLCGYFD